MTDGNRAPGVSGGVSGRSANPALLTGIGCHALWGLFPLYWPLLGAASAVEVLAHRMIWSCVSALLTLLVLRRHWGWLSAMNRRTWGLIAAAALVISFNWGTYIFAVNTGHVVEASLGYFMNPLVGMLIARIIFHERFDHWGRAGIVLAAIGIVVIAAGNWRTLWISLMLAGSFGIYGALKKTIRIPALAGLLVESGIMLLPSAVFVLWLESTGRGHFTAPGLWWLFMLAGLITMVPLWLFAIAAQGLKFSTVAVLQYIGPTMQFLIGLFVFGQRPGVGYWVGLVAVWLGCAVYLWGLGRRRRAA